MAKKKKKKEVSDFLWFPNYLPGLQPTMNISVPDVPFKYNRSTTNVGGDLTAQAFYAFYEYTFAGPVELMAAKSASQAGLLTATGVYGSLRTGLAVELGLDFALVGLALTIADPGNKWEGGLDEWGVFGGTNQPSLPGTMSGEEPNAFMWGLKQGHLGFLFGS
jgi:hypothetical protein